MSKMSRIILSIVLSVLSFLALLYFPFMTNPTNIAIAERHYQIIINEIVPLMVWFLVVICIGVAIALPMSEKETLKGILKDPLTVVPTYFALVTGGLGYSIYFNWKTVSAVIVIIFTLWVPTIKLVFKLLYKYRPSDDDVKPSEDDVKPSEDTVKIPPHKQKYIKKNKRRR